MDHGVLRSDLRVVNVYDVSVRVRLHPPEVAVLIIHECLRHARLHVFKQSNVHNEGHALFLRASLSIVRQVLRARGQAATRWPTARDLN